MNIDTANKLRELLSATTGLMTETKLLVADLRIAFREERKKNKK